jgi:soluble lytic murein transglycosylase-like protein
VKKTVLIIGAIILFMLFVTKKGKAFPSVATKIKTSYDGFIKTAAQRFQVPYAVIASIIARESSGNANVNDGGVGEIGLMQIRPEMALVDVNRVYHLNYTADDLRNVEKNIIAGTAYLSWLEKYFFPNDWPTVIRAYNCGMKWAKYNPLASIGYLKDVQAYMELFV